MKPLTIYLFLLVFVQASVGQTNTATAPNPSYVNHIYFYQTDSLITLEQADGRYESKTKALGYGGSEGGIVIGGDKSTTRIKAADSIRFIVKISMTMMDPSMMIKLYKFDLRKGAREAILSSQGGAYSRGKTVNHANEIPFNIQKSGSDNYILIPASRLSPGEYGFMNMMMVKMQGSRTAVYPIFAFGVD